MWQLLGVIGVSAVLVIVVIIAVSAIQGWLTAGDQSDDGQHFV